MLDLVKLKKLVTKLGANWNNGSKAGSFYWNVNNNSGNRNRNISGQLLYVSLKSLKRQDIFLPFNIRKL